MFATFGRIRVFTTLKWVRPNVFKSFTLKGVLQNHCTAGKYKYIKSKQGKNRTLSKISGSSFWDQKIYREKHSLRCCQFLRQNHVFYEIIITPTLFLCVIILDNFFPEVIGSELCVKSTTKNLTVHLSLIIPRCYFSLLTTSQIVKTWQI